MIQRAGKLKKMTLNLVKLIKDVLLSSVLEDYGHLLGQGS
jgi:hypothetical protein